MLYNNLLRGWWMPLCVVISPLMGCGGKDGVQRYERYGTVTFQGEPVPKGEMIISPDRSKGGSGPGTTITFEDGRFQTRKGQGVVSGPHIVQISGFDNRTANVAVPELAHPWGKVLFVEQRFEIVFPAESSEHDFKIPNPTPP